MPWHEHRSGSLKDTQKFRWSVGVHALAHFAADRLHTSKNLLSCRSCPFSARSCVTMRIASVMMEDLSVFAALPGSSTFDSSAKLQVALRW